MPRSRQLLQYHLHCDRPDSSNRIRLDGHVSIRNVNPRRLDRPDGQHRVVADYYPQSAASVDALTAFDRQCILKSFVITHIAIATRSI